MSRINEQIDPVNVPGLPPLCRHTFFNEQGEQLPDVIYSYRPVKHHRWTIVPLSILALVLTFLLIAAHLRP
jgi:hypothetical protein